ncbi:sugar ABC transporter ATPase [Paraburkholderia hayleyella]|uniref:sugar ABC transporter ATPase n=1 Tax=Paraburkholderia hayleyella TaxID=2152889 RepID=UPI0012909D8D|nr:sugar ABC transporter ATPase [Paraburkholderia hayleyella]
MTFPLLHSFRLSVLSCAALLALGACGASGDAHRAALDGQARPMMYISSATPPAAIAACLTSRLSLARALKRGSVTEVTVGERSNPAYRVTLTPSGSRTTVKVEHPADAPDNPPEPEMRFHIARCTT